MHKPKYIFCINPGRCGSHYLSQILASSPECVATHEPTPRCVGKPMQAFMHGRGSRLKALMPEKIEAIERARGDGCYFESSNAFIKGFGWLLPEYIAAEDIGVIILKRDPKKVASSYLRLGTTALTNRGRKWHILPSVPAPLHPPPHLAMRGSVDYKLAWLLSAPFRRKGPLSLVLGFIRLFPALAARIERYQADCALWQAEEVYRLADLYRTMHPSIRYFETTIEELNDYQHVLRLFDHFGLEPGNDLAALLGGATNQKKDVGKLRKGIEVTDRQHTPVSG